MYIVVYLSNGGAFTLNHFGILQHERKWQKLFSSNFLIWIFERGRWLGPGGCCMEWRGVEDKRPPGGERLLGQTTIAAISAACKVCMNLNHGCANSMTIAVSGRARSIGCSAWALITDLLLAAAPLPLDTPWALQIQPAAHNNHRGCDVLMQIGKCWTSFSKYVVY